TEAIRADQIAGEEPRQVLLLLGFGAEQGDRQDHQIRVRPEGRSKGGSPGEALADDERRHFIEVDSAVDFLDVDPQKPEIAASPDELTRKGPILLLEPVDSREDL